MSLQDLYVAQMQARIDEWNATLAMLRAKLDAAELQGRLEYHMQIDASQRQHEGALRNLDELKHSSEKAWEALKAGFDSAWNELASAIDRAKN